MITQNRRTPRRVNPWMIAFVVIFLGPSFLGFAMKFWEFLHTFRDDQSGVFAIMPMLNYLLASLGFLCLLLWAAWNGMFRDLERPKHVMLEQERALDRSQPPLHVPGRDTEYVSQLSPRRF